MATTALNGGPTGGLHATPTLPPTPDNAPQEENCRVDSNSSFESEECSVKAEPTTPTNNNAYFSDLSSKKRRKQSRPVRIPLDPATVPPNNNNPNSKASEACSGVSQQNLTQHHVPLNLSSSRAESSSEEDENKSSFNNQAAAENDKTEVLGGQGTNCKGGSPSLPPSFSPGLFAPSPFNSLFSANALNLFSSQPNPAGTPTSSSSSSGGVLNSSSSSAVALQSLPPHRIFNPEAYCDLCNKEFCNKYFLKTHKANKHGVYSDMSIGMGQVIGANSPSSNTSFLTGAVSSSPALSVPPTSSNANVIVSSHNSNSTTTAVAIPSTLGTSPSISSKGISSEIPFSLAPFSLEKGAGNSNGSQQRESFCELCQKEFCNKYFLKRHKAKIHGIPVDGSSTGSGRSSSSSNHGKSSHRSPSFSVNGGDKGLSLRDMGLESIGLEIVAKHLEEAGRREGREEGELSADDEMGLREAGKSPENLDSDENSSYRMSSGLEYPKSGSEVSSCQFCAREFPSKQLLISHLVKKHRLLIPSTFPPFLFPFPGLFEGEGEETEGVTQTSGLPTLNNVEHNGNNNNDDEAIFECSLCNRSFQTVYLLRMHKSYFHPDSASPAEDGELLLEDGKYTNANSSNNLYAKAAHNNNGGLKTETGYNSDDNDSSESGKGSPFLPEDKKTGKYKSKESKGEGETNSAADSDDLRRLQTMIMELNRVSGGNVGWSDAHLSLPPPLSMGGTEGGSTICTICNKEFYSTYFLQQHVQHFHAGGNGGLLGDSPSSFGGLKSESPLGGGSQNDNGGSQQQIVRVKTEGFSSSSSEGKKLEGNSAGITISQETLKERLLHPEAFGGSSVSGENSTFLTPGPKGAGTNSTNNNNNNNNNNLSINKDGPKRPSPSLSRSYCTICHKELCNKYFMRTHMLKMHGISIESSTGLGGVTCDICNKELCSKYFLKVHKQNTHGIVEDGPSPPNPSTPGPLPNMSQSTANFPLLPPPTNASPMTGLNLSTNSAASSPALSSSDHGDLNNPLLSKDTGELSSRYFCHYSEVCPFCGRRFRSAKWLKTHLTQDHGDEGRERWKSIERSLRRSQKSSASSSSPSKSSIGHGSIYPGGGGQSSSSSSSHQHNKGSLNNNNVKSSREGRDGNKCAFCSFSTGDVETMKNHLIKEHSSQLANRQALSDAAALQEAQQSGMLLDPLTMLFQKMEGGNTKIYRCSYCPFTTSILVYLYAHERTHGHSSNVSAPLGSGPEGPNFQCPMCFHAFDQPEAFQQHLIGHQMSGVLAPFFTPSSSTSNSGGRLGFFGSPVEGGSGTDQDPRALLSLPMLNGSGSDGLYWALKNAAASNLQTPANGPQNGEDDSKEEPAADLTTESRKKRRHCEPEGDGERKREKSLSFKCSYCQSKFPSRELALAHVHQFHGDKGEGRTENKRSRKNFRCRRCKFTTSTYQMLVVHNKVHHSSHRHAGTSRGMAESHGVATDGGGQYLMQGFILTSSEEENSNQFVPSVVYLPVREKVSQSIRVSFSLTPTTSSKSEEETAGESQKESSSSPK